MAPRAYTRVAVVQLECTPTIALSRRESFKDPLFDISRPEALRLEGHAPPELEARLDALRNRRVGRVRA